ncbi:MAG: hypothetical protein MI802_05690, partial [Desulfobacterales bacterium]|nr:hypothetical protein [Desulfobacterales bacterium]
MVMREWGNENLGPTDHNNQDAEPLIQAGLNVIRMLMDTDVTVSYSAGGLDGFGEAFTTSGGRNASVNDAETTCLYNSTDKTYEPGIVDEASGDTTHSAGSAIGGWSNISNVFDGDDSTSASGNIGNSQDVMIGKTFASTRTVTMAKFKVSIRGFGGSTMTAHLQVLNGAVWSDDQLIGSTTSTSLVTYEDTVSLNDTSIDGIRIRISHGAGSGGTTNHIYTLEYGDIGATEITLDLPSGTFASDIAAFIGVPFIKNWESGAKIECKLLNGSDDSGYFTVDT